MRPNIADDIVGSWYCPHSMRSRIYVTVRCPSVCLFVYLSRLKQRRSSFDTVRSPTGCQLSCGSTGRQHGAQQQMRAVPCLQPRDAAEHRPVFVVCAWLGQLHDCPPGRFGADCSAECHCLAGPDVCRSEDGRCTRGLCQIGWTDPPYCQTGMHSHFPLTYFIASQTTNSCDECVWGCMSSSIFY